MAHLAKSFLHCDAHTPACGVLCKPPKGTDVLVAGFSCKDLSRKHSELAMQPAEVRHSVLENKTGTSGSTFEGVCAHVAAAQPAIVILENVDELSKSLNMVHLYETFRHLGYAGSHEILCSSNYGLPQVRKRVYVVLLNAKTFKQTEEEANASAKSMLAVSKSVQLKQQEPLASFLQEREHDDTVKEFNRRKEASTGNKAEATWHSAHEQYLNSRGMTWRDAVAPQEVRSSPWFSLLPAREKDILGVHLFESTKAKSCVFGVDLNPRIDRPSFCRDGMMCAITPGSKLWLAKCCCTSRTCAQATRQWQHKCQRLVTGGEALALQGYPKQWLDKAAAGGELPGDVLLMDLAGNAFPCTVMGAVMLGVFTRMPRDRERRPPQEKNEHIDVGDLLSLVAELPSNCEFSCGHRVASAHVA